MKVKIIEKTHELDLQDALNDFIDEYDPSIVSLYYAVALTSHLGELEYSFSCLVVYS
ncbi:MAG: sporulation protein Cse60 [Erysipelotrichaceae bacterium]|nr:sporulation protein Cse60 [Erysipelotrichaceae bacterium]